MPDINRYGLDARSAIASADCFTAMTISDSGNHDRQFATALCQWQPDGVDENHRRGAREVHNIHGDMFLGARHCQRHSSAAVVA